MILFPFCLIFTSLLSGKVLGVVKRFLEPPFWSCKDHICNTRQLFFFFFFLKDLGDYLNENEGLTYPFVLLFLTYLSGEGLLGRLTCSIYAMLRHFSHVQLCATPQTAAHQAPPSLGFSRQEHWYGLPFPSLMRENEK